MLTTPLRNGEGFFDKAPLMNFQNMPKITLPDLRDQVGATAPPLTVKTELPVLMRIAPLFVTLLPFFDFFDQNVGQAYKSRHYVVGIPLNFLK